MPKKHVMLLFMLFVILSSSELTGDTNVHLKTADSYMLDEDSLSEVTGTTSLVSNYLVVSLDNSSIPSKGLLLSALLNSSGAIANLVHANDLPTSSAFVLNCSAIIIDSSMGSEWGSAVTDQVVSLLLRSDRPLVLVGRASWILHRLKATDTPVMVASLETTLHPDIRFTSDATFLQWPELVTIGSVLTQESGLQLPVDTVYHEMSTLVNLTGVSDPMSIAPLRHDGWPLDTFLFGAEDPALWTEEGAQLFLNTVAFSTSLSETSTTSQLAQRQVTAGQMLSGGYHYFHENTLDGAYWAVHAMHSILTPSEWSAWAASGVAKIAFLLGRLYVDLGSEASFKNHAADVSGTLLSTAKGLWLVSVLGIADFDEADLVAYLDARQSADGGWSSDVTITYHATEALYAAGSLGEINLTALEAWLRSCVITGARTSDPTLWGGVSSSPTTLNPSNDRAAGFVLALRMIGASHSDPTKLTEWILTRTARSDGGYNNTVMPGGESIRGTASALTAMAVMDTLGETTRTAGISWLLAAQLPSGGFGVLEYPRDLQGKVEESALVAQSLGETSSLAGLVDDWLMGFIGTCEGPEGFEIAEPLPTMMMTSWIAQAARASHGLSYSDIQACVEYLSTLGSLSEYPMWSNITVLLSPEYQPDQYRLQSVWSQLLGVSLGISLGTGLDAEMRSGAISYIYYSQSSSGHYRPTNLLGIAAMQHTVAAVEALFQLGALSQIAYRSQLEAAVMSAYSGGQWSMSGWTLRPFVGQQSAIDFLSTRCAVRLGLIDSLKAQQISDTVMGRLQYTDFWALSADIASLQLLVSHDLITDSALSSVNRTAVLGSLESAFSAGWLNSTSEWQPLYTSYVLEMISRLGLRAELYGQMGSSMTITVPSEAEAGGILRIGISIESGATEHRLFVRVADDWTEYRLVANTDTLLVPIPSDATWLGTSEVRVMLWDYGLARDWAVAETTIVGTLSGSCVLSNDVILEEDLLNGTVSWSLSGGSAGVCDVSLRLGNSSTYKQWNYLESSSMAFSVPSSGLSHGLYNLTVRVSRQYCADYIITQPVVILEPHETYITVPGEMSVDVVQELIIPYELRLLENDTSVESQTVSLEVRDQYQSVVFSDSQTTGVGGEYFSWAPPYRGLFTYVVSFARNGTLESSYATGMIVVRESTVVKLVMPDVANEGSATDATVVLQTLGGERLIERSVRLVVVSPDLQVVLDQMLATDMNGEISFQIVLDMNGLYVVSAEYAGEECLYAANTETEIVSWSDSEIQIGGLVHDGVVTDSWPVWSRLVDFAGTGVGGLVVQFQVVFLPSTIILTENQVTNSTGYAVFTWSTASAGNYRLTMSYGGCVSRGSDEVSFDATIRIPVLITVSCDFPMVGSQATISVQLSDYNSAPVSGLIVTITVRDSLEAIVLEKTTYSVNGSIFISWTPISRGHFTIAAASSRQGVYEAADGGATVVSLEQVSVLGYWNSSDLRAVKTYVLSLVAVGYDGQPIPSVQADLRITLAGATLFDSTIITGPDGTYCSPIVLNQIGVLEVIVIVFDQEYLLGCFNTTNYSVVGLTKVSTGLTGQPVLQGKLLGVVVTLVDWNGVPMLGATVRLSIYRSDWTLVVASDRITGTGGICTFSHLFDEVGDFVLVTSFAGDAANGDVSISQVQRVQVIPNLVLQSNLTAIAGEEVEFRLGLTDALGIYIAGRSLVLTVRIDSQTVFEAGLVSAGTSVSLWWSPAERGNYQVELVHPEGTYYLLNSTGGSISVLEVVSASLSVSSDQLNLFETLTINYSLVSDDASGIPIMFEVLGVDLIPIWSCVISTSESGLATAQCIMDDSAGILSVRALPTDDALMLGGGCEEQIVVFTDCELSTTENPNPPLAGHSLNITLRAADELGLLLPHLTVTVSMTDPFGSPVRLGSYSNSIVVGVIDGFGYFIFTPTMTGLYHIHLASGGSPYVRAFDMDGEVVVFTDSSLLVTECSDNIQVGHNFSAAVQLVDAAGHILVGMRVIMVLDGPGETNIGPELLYTNSSGMVSWLVAVKSEGTWIFSASFEGLGVYLPSVSTVSVDVRYGSEVVLTWNPSQDVIATMCPLIVGVLLTDSSGAPLEGRTVSYAVYHNEFGLQYAASFIQTGTDAVKVEVVFYRQGEYVVVFTFAGTDHFYGSNAAIGVFVRGTTSIEIQGDTSVDRADSASIVITLLDEIGEAMDPHASIANVSLTCDGQSVSLSSRLLTYASNITVLLYGLEIGDYELAVCIENTTVRLGVEETATFEVVTRASLETLESSVSGLVGEDHRLVMVLLDTFNECISGSVIVSLYDPSGNEVYGSPLSQSTTLALVNGETEISWNPSRVGNYTLLIRYLGTSHIDGTELNLVISTRYRTVFEITLPQRVRYSDATRMTILLRGGSGTVGNAFITIHILLDGEAVSALNATLNSLGSTQIDLRGQPAGNLTITVRYEGSPTYAPCLNQYRLEIEPIVSIRAAPVSGQFLGENMTVSIISTVEGAVSGWTGALLVDIMSPAGIILGHWQFEVASEALLYVWAVPAIAGEYRVSMTIVGLPLVDEYTRSDSIAVTPRPLGIPLDAGTTPVVSGGLALGVIAFALKRKMGSLLASLPVEWNDEGV